MPEPTLREAMLEARRAYCERVLMLANGSVPEAARIADVNRTHFYFVMKGVKNYRLRSRRGPTNMRKAVMW